MNIEFMGLSDVNGPLIALDGVTDACYEEMVDITVGDNDHRVGRIIRIEGDKAIVQVFEGTEGISLTNTRTRLTGHPLELPVARDMLGRVFDGAGRPIDGLGDICPEKRIDVNGMAINPVSREYPRDYIRTGISSIDGLCTLIKGQKLPIFSGSGMSHNELAVQIVRQANISGGNYGMSLRGNGRQERRRGLLPPLLRGDRRSLARHNVPEPRERPDRRKNNDPALRPDRG